MEHLGARHPSQVAVKKKAKKDEQPLAVPRDAIERRYNGLHLPPSVKHRPRYLQRQVTVDEAPVFFIFGGGESIAMTC
jgi:hypothetical protein